MKIQVKYLKKNGTNHIVHYSDSVYYRYAGEFTPCDAKGNILAVEMPPAPKNPGGEIRTLEFEVPDAPAGVPQQPAPEAPTAPVVEQPKAPKTAKPAK